MPLLNLPWAFELRLASLNCTNPHLVCGMEPGLVEARRCFHRALTLLELYTVVRFASQTFGQLPRGREGGNWASLCSVTDQPFG